MGNWLILRYLQFIEACQSIGLIEASKKLFFWKRNVIPVVKSLDKVVRIDQDSFSNMHLTEISRKTEFVDSLTYSAKSRKYKYRKYLKEGCRAFAVIDGKEVVGDVWYTTANNTNKKFKDLSWLNIQLTLDDAYMFDMFVPPEKRAHNVTSFLVNRSMLALRKYGYKRVFGYYDSDNIAALWFHRLHGYTELNKLTVTQYFLTKNVKIHQI